MEKDRAILELKEKIARLRKAAEEVLEASAGNEAVRCNIKKIMANVKMLELTVGD